MAAPLADCEHAGVGRAGEEQVPHLEGLQGAQPPALPRAAEALQAVPLSPHGGGGRAARRRPSPSCAPRAVTGEASPGAAGGGVGSRPPATAPRKGRPPRPALARAPREGGGPVPRPRPERGTLGRRPLRLRAASGVAATENCSPGGSGKESVRRLRLRCVSTERGTLFPAPWAGWSPACPRGRAPRPPLHRQPGP